MKKIYLKYRKMRAILIELSGMFLAFLFKRFDLKRFFVFVRIRPEIGHMSWETEQYIRLHRCRGDKRKLFFISQSKNIVGNFYYLSLLRRSYFVFCSDWLFDFFLRTEKFTLPVGAYEIPSSVCSSKECELFPKLPPVLHFTEEEENRGYEFLKKMGLKEGDWFVCFFSRDSAYLKHKYKLNLVNCDPSYHDYRDSDIKSFRKAAEYIASEGGWVFRMGSCPGQRFDTGNKQIIDYASDYNSQFLDLWLSSKCLFTIGDPSGGSQLSSIFNVPTAFTNMIPMGIKPITSKMVYIPKKIVERKTGRIVPFYEILKKYDLSEMFYTEFYEKNDYLCVDNTELEIEELTIEMLKKVRSNFRYSDLERSLLNQYFAIYDERHLSYEIPVPPGIEFLKKNSFLFIEDNCKREEKGQNVTKKMHKFNSCNLNLS